MSEKKKKRTLAFPPLSHRKLCTLLRNTSASQGFGGTTAEEHISKAHLTVREGEENRPFAFFIFLVSSTQPCVLQAAFFFSYFLFCEIVTPSTKRRKRSFFFFLVFVYASAPRFFSITFFFLGTTECMTVLLLFYFYVLFFFFI